MDNKATQAPAGWLEALENSKAEIAAGLSVPMETVMQDLRDSVVRLEAKRETKQTHKVARRG